MLTLDFFSSKGFPLSKLAGVLDKKPTLQFRDTPLCQIVAVDVGAGSVTINLDKDIECFDPELEQPRHS